MTIHYSMDSAIIQHHKYFVKKPYYFIKTTSEDANCQTQEQNHNIWKNEWTK